jgi:hypothetical protein
MKVLGGSFVFLLCLCLALLEGRKFQTTSGTTGTGATTATTSLTTGTQTTTTSRPTTHTSTTSSETMVTKTQTAGAPDFAGGNTMACLLLMLVAPLLVVLGGLL